jgi:outer membrane receptor protein involved in Fe transport
MGSAGLAILGLAAGSVAAQETAAPGGDTLGEVTVTGSRIVRDGYEAPTPVSVLGTEQLNRMAVTNIADAVNRLPVFAGSVNPRNSSTNVSSGTGGVNNLNLRGLGPTRTLVLLDGKRIVGSTLAGFDNNGSSVDVNSIPSSLISRVEVVTGGASAVYGSDALAGVVNFVLDKKFTGVKGSLEGGETTHSDAQNYKGSVTFGTPFAGDRGHFLFSFEHAAEEGIKNNPRDWADQSFSLINNPGYAAGNGQPSLLTVRDTGLSNATRGGLIVSPGPLRGTQFVAGGATTPFTFGPIISGNVMVGGDWQRSRIDTDPTLNIDLKRNNAFTRASYDIAENVTVFGELQWSKSNAYNASAVPNFNLGNVTIRSGNPFIPASVQSQMTANNIASFTMGTVNGDMPFLQGDNVRTFRRYVAGVEGNFDAVGTNWKWDGYYERSTNHISAKSPGNRINANYALATNAVRNAAGNAVCAVNADASAANDVPACVPYNPMGLGVNSREAIAYVTGKGWSETIMQQDVAAVSANGEPFSTWAAPVSLAFGVEHRRESVEGTASEIDKIDGFFAGNYHPTSGDYHATEGFIETVVPLAKDAAFAKELDFNAAVRLTDYSTSGRVTTWKAGLSWAPIDDVRFRLTRSRDIRAPNLGDLYNAGRTGTGAITDPLKNNSTYTIVSRITGNPNLKPEEADTTGVGVVFTPTFLSGFAASIDYYSIDIADAIASLDRQQYVDRCLAGTTEFCPFISRDENGFIYDVNVKPANILKQKASGVDVELSYRFPLLNGEMALRALGTYVDSLQTVDTAVVEGAGVNADDMGVGAGSALFAPELRYLASATYTLDPVSLTLSARGIGSGKYNNSFIECSSGCPDSTLDHPTINDNHIPGVTYFDLALDYKILGDRAEAFLVAENVLDKDPPLIAGSRSNGYYAGQGNTKFYDRLGRMLRLGVRFDF